VREEGIIREAVADQALPAEEAEKRVFAEVFQQFVSAYGGVGVPDQSKQFDALHELMTRCQRIAGEFGQPSEWPKLLHQCVDTYADMRRTDKKFFGKKPFLPAWILSFWDQIIEEVKGKLTRDIEEERIFSFVEEGFTDDPTEEEAFT
jgi:hypothetical protein